MQFHHHGYVSGDPTVRQPEGSGIDRPVELPELVDVLIVGSGPAGSILAAQLSQFPDIVTRMVEQRGERLAVGQADGLACRSLETFQAFGFREEVEREAYRITETTFWGPDPKDPANLIRTARTPDDPRGVSEFQHMICNQARVQDRFTEVMRKSPTKMETDYGLEFVGQSIDEAEDYPVLVTLRHTTGERAGTLRTVRTKYLVGCDGARSAVRQSIGRKLQGDSANHAWGVMDVLAVTDFPDIRTKGVITSADGGNILLIPREGGHLFRLYVDLGVVTPENAGTIRKTPNEESIKVAQQILHPFTLDVKHVAWSSVYEVGQRVTDKFDDVDEAHVGTAMPRVFIAGDACHTHSAKAGQGMNVSMQDGFNLGWKLAAVLRGQSPATLLDTYSGERQPIAQQLIDFDKEWSTLMASKPLDPEHPELGGVDPAEFRAYYMRSFDFTMGFGTQYALAPLTGTAEHTGLATGFPLGQRFHSAPVMRVADANPKHLGHLATADGRWRIYVFADEDRSELDRFATWLDTDPSSPLNQFTPASGDRDAVFETKVVLQQDYTNVDIRDIAEVFKPRKAPFGLIDLEQIFAAVPDDDIFASRGIARTGVVVVVRPDMYVASVTPLSDPAALASYLDPVFVPVA